MASNLLYVTQEQRDDLRALARMTQDDLRGYAFHKIFPVLNVREKSGTIYVAEPNLTNNKGQVGRSDDSELTKNNLATKKIDYVCNRVEARVGIYEHEMHGYSDSNAAIEQGAIAVGRKMLNTLEANAAAQVFNDTRVGSGDVNCIILENHKVIDKLQMAAKNVRAYGKSCLVMTDAALLFLCNIPEIRVRLESFAKVQGDIGFMALQDEKIRASLSTLLGFYHIALFDSAIVNPTDGKYDNYIGVLGVRDEVIGAPADRVLGTAKSVAMFGAMLVAIPNGSQDTEPFILSTSPDTTKKENLFDAEGWVKATEFSPATADDRGGAYICKFDTNYTEYGS